MKINKYNYKMRNYYGYLIIYLGKYQIYNINVKHKTYVKIKLINLSNYIQ